MGDLAGAGVLTARGVGGGSSSRPAALSPLRFTFLIRNVAVFTVIAPTSQGCGEH